jgi:hypothetical protein
MESTMTKASKPNYLAKVAQLSKVEAERLLSRMGGKLDRRLEKGKLSQQEALARQLELEDEQLQEWRKVMLSLKKKEETKEAKKKEKAKAKVKVKVKAPAKAKVSTAEKVKAPVKTPAKVKAPVKAKAPAKAKASTTAKAESAK